MPHDPQLIMEQPLQYPNENYDPFAKLRAIGGLLPITQGNPDFDPNMDPMIRKVPVRTPDSWLTAGGSYLETPEMRQEFRDFQDRNSYSQIRSGDIELPNQAHKIDPRLLQGLKNAKP